MSRKYANCDPQFQLNLDAFVYIYIYMCTYFCNWNGRHCTKINCFSNFDTLILKVNMNDSKNNQALRLGLLKLTPEGKCPVKFSVMPHKSSVSCTASCIGCAYTASCSMELSYAELRSSVTISSLYPPCWFNSASRVSEEYFQGLTQRSELHQCRFTHTECMNEGLCPWWLSSLQPAPELNASSESTVDVLHNQSRPVWT